MIVRIRRGLCGCKWRERLFHTLAVIVALTGGHLWLPQTTLATPVTSFDDITFWVGSGEHRAAVAIDWDESGAADEALVWGYRFDGMSNGEAMLRTVVEADSRLFVKLDPPVAGLRLFGLGYDLDDDRQFGISDDTTFDANGFAESLQSDGATATDLGDLYAEGWIQAYWHYGKSDGNPYDGGMWVHSPSGMTDRVLEDGDWDSWTFSPSFSVDAFAENPHAAEPPIVQSPADFDADGDVDGDDFLIWQTGFGLSPASHAQGDADADGDVDGDDFLIWQSEFGIAPTDGSAGAMRTRLTVPEPSARLLATVLSLLLCFLFRYGCVHHGSHLRVSR